jgi:hypothetical protein
MMPKARGSLMAAMTSGMSSTVSVNVTKVTISGLQYEAMSNEHASDNGCSMPFWTLVQLLSEMPTTYACEYAAPGNTDKTSN